MISSLNGFLRVALTGLLLVASLGLAGADRVILTPSATALYADSARADFEQSLSSGDPVSTAHLNMGFQYLELEASDFYRPHQNAAALGVQTQLLPESEDFPSVSAGIRDIGNMTHSFGKDGYFGRSYYLVAGRTPTSLATAPFPLRNLTVTVGLGGGALHGLFGSLSTDFPLGLRGTVEWDTRAVNSRIALPFSRYAQIEYTDQAGESIVGLEVHHLLSF